MTWKGTVFCSLQDGELQGFGLLQFQSNTLELWKRSADIPIGRHITIYFHIYIYMYMCILYIYTLAIRGREWLHYTLYNRVPPWGLDRPQKVQGGRELWSDIVLVTKRVRMRAQDEIRPFCRMFFRSASIWLFHKYAKTFNMRKHMCVCQKRRCLEKGV